MVLSGDDVKVKAKMLSENLGYEKRINFSNGWLQRFKRRNDLRCKKLIGEKQNADLEAAENFVTETLPDLLSKFKPDQVFNAYETGLNYRLLPDRGFVLSDSTIHGGKKLKERLTILVCCSMSGEKKRLLVIGKSAKPRRFPREMSTLPTDYDFSNKSWMNLSKN